MSARGGIRGFSIIEAVMVLVIVATVLGMLAPSVSTQLTHARVNRAAGVIGADLMLAQSLAGRQHAPVQVTFDVTARTLTLSNAANGATLITRRFGTDSEFKLGSLAASTTSFVVLPNGRTSPTGTVVTLTGAGRTHYVAMSTAGQVRVN